jgi:predicted enzyme related to lactoylglutathione lyase
MANTKKPKIGAIIWTDLTVKKAAKLCDFYRDVTGWKSSEVAMGDYNDFSMNAADGKTVAGICHARGENAKLPPQWLIYINVADIDGSVKRAVDLGGKLITEIREMGGGRMCVIRDPAGAVAALFEPKQ